MRRSLLTQSLVSVFLLASILGCSKSEPAAEVAKPAATQTQPASGGQAVPAAPVTSAGAPMPAQAVIASAQFSGDPDMRCDLLEVKRNSGGSVTIKWRVVNTAGSGQAGLVASQGKRISYSYHWDQIYYIDPAENKKYNFLTDAEGKRILDVYEGTYEPGQTRGNWAKFPAPPASSKKITISIPNFPPFEDVPVAE